MIIITMVVMIIIRMVMIMMTMIRMMMISMVMISTMMMITMVVIHNGCKEQFRGRRCFVDTAAAAAGGTTTELPLQTGRAAVHHYGHLSVTPSINYTAVCCTQYRTFIEDFAKFAKI
jgi:hypothetical protein